VAAKDPARQSLLDAGAKVRRDELRKEEAASRASQGRTHAEAVELLREKLSAQGKSPILRVAIEHELEQKAATHAEEVRVVDDYFAMRWASTEAAIKTAGELGYFTDARAEAEGRAADRETGRGDDEGGRGMED
jgi:glycerophosphoryl diester phosphodiesterase